MIQSIAGMIEGRDGKPFSYFAEMFDGRVIVCGCFNHGALALEETVFFPPGD